MPILQEISGFLKSLPDPGTFMGICLIHPNQLRVSKILGSSLQSVSKGSYLV